MGVASAAAAQSFGKYTLVAKLATGGMAEIFLARLVGAAGFEKLVCIKRILPHLAKDQVLVQMFLAEARIAAQISHPNVCQVFELGDIDGRYFIAMEYLEGVPFSCFRRRDLYPTHPDPRLVAGLGMQACEGLHHAHQLKRPDGSLLEVVHRDVSSNNLFATVDGVVKVLDFGIAKVQDASVRTTTGSVKGTYAYMAPEQLRGEPVDRRTDVFACGIVLWELFARRHLFKRDTDFLTFQAITTDPIPEVAELRPDVPPELSWAIARALSRDREERFPTARAFGEALAESVQSIGGPLGAAAIADEIARAFEVRMRDQQALIRIAREGGALDLDDELGPAIGHGTVPVTTPVSFASSHGAATEMERPSQPSRPSRPSRQMPVERPSRPSRQMPAARPSRQMVVEPPPAPEPDPTSGAWQAPPARQTEYVRAAAPGRSWLPIVLLVLIALVGLGTAGYFYLQARLKEVATAQRAAAPPPTTIAMPVTKADGTAPAAAPSPSEPAAPAATAAPAAAGSASAAAGSASAPTDTAAPTVTTPAPPPTPTFPTTRSDTRPPSGAPKKDPIREAPKAGGPPGFITIDSTPMYSTIFIDGKSYGETPLVRISLPSGKHAVRAVSPSGTSRTMTIAIEPGKVAPTRRIEW
jgi:serine/threonine protein kinase